MRKLALVFLAVLVAGLMSARAGIAVFTGAEAEAAEENRAAVPQLLGIHHLSLRDGVSAEEFERFVIEEWNPVMADLYPGIRQTVLKGERNAEPSQYRLVFDIQSARVRDWYWPQSGEGSEASMAIDQACGDPCAQVWEKFSQMTETTSWADWVALSRD